MVFYNVAAMEKITLKLQVVIIKQKLDAEEALIKRKEIFFSMTEDVFELWEKFSADKGRVT